MVNKATSTTETSVEKHKFISNSKLLFAVSQALVVVQVALFVNPIAGVYLNAIVFALLVRVAIVHDKARDLAISVAILPVANMISLSLPQTTSFARTVVFYDSILILGLIYRFMLTLDQPVKTTKLTVRGYLTLLPAMIILGQLLGGIGYLMLRHHYSFNHISLPLVAATSVVFAISEEVIFRGLIQQRAEKAMHPIAAAVLSTLLYTAYSFGHGASYLTPLFALLMGSILAFIYYKKQNLVLTICVNAVSKLVYISLLANFIFRK